MTPPKRCYDIIQCIRRYDWKALEFACINHANLFEDALDRNLNTPLHEICSIGSAPYHLVEKIFHLFPEAALVQNKRGDTPLHLKCKISQKSLQIVNLLVEYCPNVLILKNGIGQTPLAVACDSAASFPVIEKLVESNPTSLSIRDNQGNSPIDLLWSSFLMNIPGVLSMKSYLHGMIPMSGILARFWEKVCFCLIESYKLQQKSSEKLFWEKRTRGQQLCHSIISERLKQSPIKLLQMALLSDPHLACQTDRYGNTPLHLTAKSRDERTTLLLLKISSKSANERNAIGKLPLHLFLQNAGKGNHAIVEAFIVASPDSIASVDENNLFPFMIAASSCDAATSYQLLSAKPDIITW